MRFRYTVYATRSLFAPANPLLRQVLTSGGGVPRVAFIVDAGVARHHPQLLAQTETYCAQTDVARARPALVLPGGEPAKNDPQYVHRVHELVHRAGLCRHSFIVAIGGGALLDAVGFAAATAHRGLRLVRVPTTVLAQCDAGIGVKNGINRFGKKNFIGTFSPPYAVINDAAFLTTLGDRDWRAGLAEAVKVALLKDRDFFGFLESHADALVQRDLACMAQAIARCAALHLAHIGGSDPFESGSSRPLDFGHWAAHRLEALTGHRLRHGEAVAIGIALDATYAHLQGLLPAAAWQRILRLLAALGFDLWMPELASPALASGLAEFREHLGGDLTITLLRDIGLACDVHEIDLATVRAALPYLKHHDWTGGMPWQPRPAHAR